VNKIYFSQKVQLSKSSYENSQKKKVTKGFALENKREDKFEAGVSYDSLPNSHLGNKGK